MYIGGNFETVKSGKFCIHYTYSPNLVSHWLFRRMIITEVIKSNNSVDTWRKLDVHKTFNLCPVSTGKYFTNLSLSVLYHPIYHYVLYYPISTSKLTTQTILFLSFFSTSKSKRHKLYYTVRLPFTSHLIDMREYR